MSRGRLGVPVLESSLASFRCSTILVIESMVPFLYCESAIMFTA